MNFQDSSFAANFIDSSTPKHLITWISQNSEFKSITESFWGSRWQFHLHRLSNYLYLFWKQPASNFFRNNNYCFPDQGNVGHHTKKVTEKGIDLYIKYLFKAHFMRIFAAAKASLVIIRTQLRFHFELFLMCPYHPQGQPNLLLVSLGMSGPLWASLTTSKQRY